MTNSNEQIAALNESRYEIRSVEFEGPVLPTIRSSSQKSRELLWRRAAGGGPLSGRELALAPSLQLLRRFGAGGLRASTRSEPGRRAQSGQPERQRHTRFPTLDSAPDTRRIE